MPTVFAVSQMSPAMSPSEGSGIFTPLSPGRNPAAPFRPTPDVMQVTIAGAFEKFLKQFRKTQQALFEFSNASKQLDKSASAVSSTNMVTCALEGLKNTMHENAIILCPHKVKKPQDDDRDLNFVIPDMLKLAQGMTKLLESITTLSQFQDREVQVVFESFSMDLVYWANCLREYERRYEDMAIRRYVQDMIPEVITRLNDVVESISYFTTTAIPMVAIAQHHDPVNIQNLTTIATFFSAVTATTLQFTFQPPHNTITSFVNACWFSSLVFSVASTVNLLLGALLLRVLYRTPVRVPRGIYLWLYGSPLAFLVIAVACFSIGLVGFAYASDQHRVVATITSVFSAFTYVGIVIVTAWFIYARWVFKRKTNRTKKTSLPVTASPVTTTPLWARFPLAIPRMPRFWRRNIVSRNGDANDITSISEKNQEDVSNPLPTRQHALLDGAVRKWMSLVNINPRLSTPGDHVSDGLDYYRSFLAIPRDHITGCSENTQTASSNPYDRPAQPSKVRIRDIKFSPNGKYLAVCGGEQSSSVWYIQGPHDEAQVTLFRKLDHPQGFADEVAWSPDGLFLVTKLKRSIILGKKNPEWEKNEINHDRRVKSVTWLSDSQSFLSLENNIVIKMDIGGKILAEFLMDHLYLRSIGVSPAPGCRWLVAVAISKDHPSGTKPSREDLDHHSVLLYDMDKQEIRIQIPLFHDVREASMDTSGGRILVKFKGGTAPQLWEIEDTIAQNDVQISLAKVYISSKLAVSSRLGSFIGHDSHLVVTNEDDHGITFFHRETGDLTFHLPWDTDPEERRCLAYNGAVKDKVVIATGSDEGIRLWTAAPKQPLENPISRPNLASAARLRSSAMKVVERARTPDA